MLFSALLRFGNSATHSLLRTPYTSSKQHSTTTKDLLDRFPDPPPDPRVSSHSACETVKPQLQSVLIALRTLITPPSAAQDLSDEILLACFSSRLLSVPLEHRPAIATHTLFRIFADLLTMTPPAPIVDGICCAIAAAVCQPAETNEGGRVITPERINTAYVTRVCPPALVRVLCDLVLKGKDYASRELFAALRLFVSSEDFKNLASINPSRLLQLSHADASGIVQSAAYSLHPFPKPDFPLSETCLPLRMIFL
jgi:hypothetical protein